MLMQVFHKAECIPDGSVLEDFRATDLDDCILMCRHVPRAEFYVYDKLDHGCHCLNSNKTQECDYIRGPDTPSYSECRSPGNAIIIFFFYLL